MKKIRGRRNTFLKIIDNINIYAFNLLFFNDSKAKLKPLLRVLSCFDKIFSRIVSYHL